MCTHVMLDSQIYDKVIALMDRFAIPRHWNCRSVWVPVLPGDFDGDIPFLTDDEANAIEGLCPQLGDV